MLFLIALFFSIPFVQNGPIPAGPHYIERPRRSWVPYALGSTVLASAVGVYAAKKHPEIITKAWESFPKAIRDRAQQIGESAFVKNTRENMGKAGTKISTTYKSAKNFIKGSFTKKPEVPAVGAT